MGPYLPHFLGGQCDSMYHWKVGPILVFGYFDIVANVQVGLFHELHDNTVPVQMT